MVTVHQLRQEILALQGGSPGLQMLVCVQLVFFNVNGASVLISDIKTHKLFMAIIHVNLC